MLVWRMDGRDIGFIHVGVDIRWAVGSIRWCDAMCVLQENRGIEEVLLLGTTAYQAIVGTTTD